MIRRDYILRMIEEFARALALIQARKSAREWTEAEDGLDDAFRKLIGKGAAEIGRLSESELFALAIDGEPTSAVRDKTLMLAAMLEEAAGVAEGQSRTEEARNLRLKALHLILGALAQSEAFELPGFVPRVDALAAALEPPLPPRTLGLLMHHYERAGVFGRAEDALFALRDQSVEGATEFGLQFYERILALSDDTLERGGLPRSEAEESLGELRARAAS